MKKEYYKGYTITKLNTLLKNSYNSNYLITINHDIVDYSNTIQEAYKIIDKQENKEALKQILFENACDDLYFGYGFKSFLEFEKARENTKLFTEKELKIIWEKALYYMEKEN